MYDLRDGEIMDLQSLSRNGDALVMEGKSLGLCRGPSEVGRRKDRVLQAVLIVDDLPYAEYTDQSLLKSEFPKKIVRVLEKNSKLR